MKNEPLVVKHSLVNGLPILLIPQKQAPVVALQGWVKFGAADETDDVAGVAHLFEHLLFKGTTQRKVGQIAQEVEGLGGDLNAYTSYDQTVMHLTVPSSALDQGLDILSDSLLNSVVEPDELERERPVILEEIKRRNDMPWSIASDLVRSEIFKGHTYARPVIGYSKVVESIPREKILSLYKQHYNAKNMFLVIAGDIDEGHALKQAAECFRMLQPGAVPGARPKLSPLSGVVTRLKHHSSPDTNLQFSWRGVSLADHKAACLDALGLILGQGESSRFNRKLVQDEKLLREISCGSWTPKDIGSFGIHFQANPNVAKNFSKILSCIQEATESPFTQEELQKAKKNLLASDTYSKETVDGLAQRFGYFEALVGDWNYDNKYRESVEALTLHDLEEARRKILDWENVVWGGIVPEKEKLPEYQIPKEKKQILKTEISPTRKKFKVDEKWGVENFEINGLRVFVRKLNHLPIFSWRWMGLGGQRVEPPLKAGLGSLWARSVTTGGTAPDGKKWRREAINECLDQSSAGLSASFGKNSWGLSMDGLSEDLPKLTEVFFASLLEPQFDPKIVEHEADHQILDIKSSQDQPTTRVSLAFQKAMFGKHPLSRFALGDPKVIKKIKQKDLVSFHKLLLNSPQVLAVTGDVDAEKIYHMLECALWNRTIKKPNSSLLKPKKPKYPTKSVTIREKLQKEQTHILLGVPTVPLSHPDRWALSGLSAILSGQGGRLFAELRDKQSLCYTVAPTALSGIDGGYFGFYIATSPEKEKTAVAGLKNEIHRLVNSGVTQEEWDKSSQFYIGNHLIDQQRFGPQASGMALDELYGLGFEEFFNFEKIFKSITVKDINAVVKKYFGNNFEKRLVTSVVGPRC